MDIKKPITAGSRSGLLTALAHRKGNLVDCICSCGNSVTVKANDFRREFVKSCGCLRDRKGKPLSHGHYVGRKKSTTVNVWSSMMDRCYNQKHKHYMDYGGRGISVCDQWRESFANFLEDMGPRPTGMSIDRLDNNGNYCKENCRWVDQSTQCRNKRNNVLVVYQGAQARLIDLAEKAGIPYQKVWRRARKFGWTLDRALTER